MANIWPIGGGKGGVGKSFLTANLGLWLAKQGNKTLLIDADLGAANLHTMIGIRYQQKSLWDFIHKKVHTLSETVIPTHVPNLFLISSARDHLDTADVAYEEKIRILHAISGLSYDFILLDLGAGISSNTIDFFMVSDSAIFVTTPEPTSIENVYRLIRAVYARKIRHVFKSQHFETPVEEVQARANGDMVNNPEYLLSIIQKMGTEKGKAVEMAQRSFQMKLVLNQCRTQDNPKTGALICRVIEKHLGLPVQCIGNIAYNDLVHAAVCLKVPFLDKYAYTQTAAQLGKICRQILMTGSSPMDGQALENVAGRDEISGEYDPMRPLSELTRYELLDLSPGATPLEIRTAYKTVLAVYREDAMVSYSLFSAEERKEVLARLKEAFSTLIDEKARAAYDQSLIQQGALKEEAQYWGLRRKPSPFDLNRPNGSTHIPAPPEGAILQVQAAENPVVKEILSQEVLTGKDLKRLRSELGISLEEITERTKIRSEMFRCIEEDHYDQLPSRFHLKSFLKAYAQYLRLEPGSVVGGYMKRIQGKKPNPRLSECISIRIGEFLKRTRIFCEQGRRQIGRVITTNRVE